MKEEKTKLFLYLILVLSVVGIADSIHLLEIKYTEGKGAACDLSERFDCTTVNQSAWSAILAFPTAGIGLIGYALLAFMSFSLMSKEFLKEYWIFKKLFKKGVTDASLLGVAILGLIIQLYYTSVEFFILNQFCVFCLFSQALIIGIVYFAYKNLNR